MTTSFDDVRLPEEVEQGSYGGPGFNTTIIDMSSGQEQRNIDWSEARCAYDITYGIDSKDNFNAVLAFFRGRRGRGRGFRFKDWSDFELSSELIGTGNGVQTDFPIIKTYDVTLPYVRRITRPIADTVSVTVAGSPVSFSLNATSSAVGVLTATANLFANDTVTIGGIQYKAQSPVAAGAGHFLVGANAAETLRNLARAINQSGAGADAQATATGTLTITSTNNFLDTETVTIGATTYTAQTVFTAAAGHFKIGANKAESLRNLARCINHSGAGGATATAAVGTFTGYADNFSDGDTVTIRSAHVSTNGPYSTQGTGSSNTSYTDFVYVAQRVFTAGKGHFLIGKTWAESFTNLARCINGTGTGAGSLYDHVNTPSNDGATASESSPMVLTAIVAGTASNQTLLSTSASYVTWGTTAMVGGVNAYGFGGSITPGVQATATLTGGTVAGNLLNGDTVTLGATTYMAQTAFTNGAGHFKIGANLTQTLTNLARCINQSGSGGGTLYDTSVTVANTSATATEASPMVATAITAGTGGNSVATTSSAAGYWSAMTLLGGEVANLYDSANTTANASVTASETSPLVATARTSGSAANTVATTETAANASWGATTLTGGLDTLYDGINTDPNPYVTASETSPMVVTARTAGKQGNVVDTSAVTVSASWASTTLIGGDSGGANHVVHLSTPPTVGQAVRVSGEFDVPVRFDSDNIQIVMQQAKAGSINDLTISELRE